MGKYDIAPEFVTAAEVTLDDIDEAVRCLTEWTFGLMYKTEFITTLIEKVQNDEAFLRSVAVILSLIATGDNAKARKTIIAMHRNPGDMFALLAERAEKGELPMDKDHQEALVAARDAIRQVFKSSDENSIK